MLFLSLRALEQPLTGKTSIGARAFGGFQACFFGDRYLNAPAFRSGVVLDLLHEFGGVVSKWDQVTEIHRSLDQNVPTLLGHFSLPW